MTNRPSAPANEVGIALQNGVFTLTAPSYAVDITDTQIVIHRTPPATDRWVVTYSGYGTPTDPEWGLVKKEAPADPTPPDTSALAELEQRAAQAKPKVRIGPERHARPVKPEEQTKPSKTAGTYITSRLPFSRHRQPMRHIEDIAKQRPAKPASACWTSSELAEMLGQKGPIYAFNLALRQKDPLPVVCVIGGKSHQKYGFPKDLTTAWVKRNMPGVVIATAVKEGKKRG